MGHPLLRLNDGRDDTSPQLRPDVEDLQRALNMHGLSVEVDGVFGTDTRAAVQQFQHEQGLNDDGIVGPLTWAALEGQPPPDPRTTIPHTIPSSDVAILRQFAEATKYKPLVDTACSATNLATYIIGGLGSRESNWGLVLTPPGPAGTGDFAKRRFPTPHRSGPLPGDGGFGLGSYAGILEVARERIRTHGQLARRRSQHPLWLPGARRLPRLLQAQDVPDRHGALAGDLGGL